MRYTKEQIEKIVQLKEQGLNIKQISKETNLDRDAISRHLRKLGYSTKLNPIYENIFEKIDTEEKAYWLGFLSADGYVSKHNQIEVSLQLSDIHHLEKLKAFVNTNTVIGKDIKIGRCRLCFASKKMAIDLAKLGCTNKKSLTLKCPLQEQVPDNLFRHFVRGYVDGDGCLCFTKITYEVSITGTEEFLNKMLQRMNWDKLEKNWYPSGKAVTVRFHRKDIKPCLKQLYDNSNIYLDRKYEKYKAMIAV